MAVNHLEHGRLLTEYGQETLDERLSHCQKHVAKNKTMNRLAGMDFKETANDLECRKLLEKYSKEDLDNKLLGMCNGRRRGVEKLRLLNVEKNDQGKSVHAKKKTIKHYKEKAEKLLLSGEQCYKFTCVNRPDVIKAAKRGGWANRTKGQLNQCCPNCNQHKVPRNLIFDESGRTKTRWWIVEKVN